MNVYALDSIIQCIDVYWVKMHLAWKTRSTNHKA